MTPKELSDIRRKLKALNYAKELGNAAAACRRFGISGESFYKWKRAYERDGERALINSKPCPQNPELRTPAHIEEKILYLRRTYHPGRQPIAWYLLQYTAIDDATRIRALRVYRRHNREDATDFVNYFVNKSPSRTHTTRADHGHEPRAESHRHVTHPGINHTFIRVRTPRPNGKVERSHRTDKIEFYQLPSYADDVDLNEELEGWGDGYNHFGPHRPLNGKTPYEVLRDKLQSDIHKPRF